VNVPRHPPCSASLHVEEPRSTVVFGGVSQAGVVTRDFGSELIVAFFDAQR
jgi:hypothetical protein